MREIRGIEKRVLRMLNPIVVLLAHLKVPPNVLTVSGLIASVVAFYFLIEGFIFWAGITIILIGLFDVLDGELARRIGQTSKCGALFDSTVDRYAEGFLYLGLIVYFWERSLLVVILVMAAVVGSLLVSYVRARAEGLGVECSIGLMQRKERLLVLIFGTILGSIEVTGSIFLGLAIGIIAVLSHFTVIQRMIYVRQQINKGQK